MLRVMAVIGLSIAVGSLAAVYTTYSNTEVSANASSTADTVPEHVAESTATAKAVEASAASRVAAARVAQEESRRKAEQMLAELSNESTRNYRSANRSLGSVNKDFLSRSLPTTQKIRAVAINQHAPKISSAVRRAGRSGKKVFVLFTSKSCIWCRRLETQVLNDANVKRNMAEYVTCYVDINRESSTANKYLIKHSVPQYMILDGNGRLEKSEMGFQEANDFLDWIGS